ncbi:hypothetical protein EH31_10830 [Erythrobacter longus]|uniref:DUF1800 domain-containing protein n=1 Tax=Erythrobacter longus TaxID=1044 RepID=A0A074MFD9_ERYLO|nr:DUF1800 family protein [Erythrobacter longus]KEO90573.1 hypothetical protein EH31_10830 [Erythrobacter longus]
MTDHEQLDLQDRSELEYEADDAPNHGTGHDTDRDPQEKPPSKTSLAAVSTIALATAACGGGGGSGGGGTPPPTGGGGTPAPTALSPDTDAQAARFALQAGLSVSTGDILEMRSEGYERWLDNEINQPIERSAQQFLSDIGFEAIDAEQWFFRSDPADYMIWNQLLTGSNSVRKRVALALSEFFVVSVNNIQIWPSTSIGAYWDILKEGAFGNFRDMLEAITLNAGMGVFLNTLGNQKADPATGRVPDENYAREVMQLFSIGLFELNIDGTERLDGSGNPIETYDNDDVTGIAKVFTGYNYSYEGNITFQSPPDRPNLNIPEARLLRNPMTANSFFQIPNRGDQHSMEEKSFLGVTIPSGTGAQESLRIAMDTLFNHPNVGPFFGKQMIQRLVTSNPSPAYVQRVAEVFNNNGSGVRGDLRAVFKAILLDDEALSLQSLADPTFGKLREPMLRFAQWGRTFGARSETTAWLMRDLSDRSRFLSQSPLRSPSVFNFFRPGFIPANSQAAERDLLAPEFQLVNETTAASYVNFMERTIDGRGFWMFDIKATYQDELEIVDDTDALLDRLDLLLTAGQLSETSRTTIADALNAQTVTATSSEEDKLAQVHRAVLLVMVSNDYLIQR